MKKTLAKKYHHKDVEAGKYEFWLEHNCFYADEHSEKPSFTIVIPPPNVTGKLHVGHAWDTAIQDIIIRMKRMQGYNALYLPGMDHAGIATQAKVDERLQQSGTNRHEIGRKKFIDKAWEWKEEYAQSIRAQWYKLGLSLDYTKERFTLDEGLSDAVSKVFVDLYDKGIIYQGHRIINWDPKQKTALSNIEVIYKDVEGMEHYFKYMFADGSGEYLTIMTTRPETMFGDGAIAVHPDDTRYQHLIGQEVIVPITHYQIPIIADEYVAMDKGSGCVKITPAHDPNDYEVGMRHNIKQDIIMNLDGTMASTDRVPLKYQGLDRYEARQQYVADAHNAGLVAELKPLLHSVGHSERSGVVVEPYLSKQWFVNMEQLAQKSIDAQDDDDLRVNFYPPRFEKVFLRWMSEVQDWCISRQLWWGHQIPAWYHKQTKEVYVSQTPPSDIENWEQDEDVLDTWFSSALWPFSTLGWPETQTSLYHKFFPTNVLVTGYDIIFFWVSRMMFQSLEFTGNKPFSDVLIHGLVRDAEGHKMSKSLGNGIDPMDAIEQFGADSLRYFLVTNTAPGQDVRYMEQKVEAASNFANKIWNAARFVLHENEETTIELQPQQLDAIDLWVLDKMNIALKDIAYNAEKYEFGEVGRALYHFIWNDFCNWYIELSKPVLYSDDVESKRAKQRSLLFILDHIVRMLHPFMPYITEEIWQALPHTTGSIVVSEYPLAYPLTGVQQSLQSVEQMMEAIVGMRQIRSDYNVAPSKPLPILIDCVDEEILLALESQRSYLERFMNAAPLTMTTSVSSVEQAERKIFADFVLIVPMDTLVNMEEQRQKLLAEKDKMAAEIQRCEGMLANQNFVAKAPQSKIDAEQAKLAEYQKQLQLIEEQLARMPQTT